jgi:hypothetical protein
MRLKHFTMEDDLNRFLKRSLPQPSAQVGGPPRFQNSLPLASF